MGSLSASDKQEIADELKRVATWVTGPRQARVEALRARILGEEVEDDTPPEGQVTPSGAHTGGQNQPVDQRPPKAPQG